MINTLKTVKEFKDYLMWETTTNNNEMLAMIIKYIDLLEQPLKLGMFVPCDDSEEVLHKPKECDKLHYETESCNCDLEYIKKFQQAKKRVLFAGFELCGGRAVENKELGLLIMLDSMQFMIESHSGYGGGDLFGENIESLSKIGVEIKLTDNFKKLITG